MRRLSASIKRKRNKMIGHEEGENLTAGFTDTWLDFDDAKCRIIPFRLNNF